MIRYGPIPQLHNPADFDIVAESLNAFMDAIALPEPCKVLLNANIDMTDIWMTAPQHKLIRSNGKIKVRKLFKDPNITAIRENCFVFNPHDNVDMQVFLTGPQGEILDQNYAKGMIGGIKVEGVNFKLTNSVLSKLDYMGVLIENGPEALIEHNTFSNIRRNGFGYCVWQRSKGDGLFHNAYVRWNRFLNFRHCIDGSSQANRYHFENNLIYGNSSNSPVARHNNDTFQGGAGDVIRNNWFCDRSSPFSLQEVVE